MIGEIILEVNSIGFQVMAIAVLTIAVGIIGMLIYFRKKDTEQIKIAETIFENLKDAMIITDYDTRITYANKVFVENTNYEFDEILGKTPAYLSSGIHDKKFFDEMWNTIQRLGMWQGEIWDKKKGGEVHPKYLTITKIGGVKKEKVRYIGIFQDITEIKKKEEHIERLEKYDLFTGLPNEKYLKNILKKKMDSEVQDGETMFLILVRLSNYNDIVASYGYGTMDKVILNLINRFKLIFNDIGILFRTGKEDFIILGTINRSTHELDSIIEELNNVIGMGFSCDGELVFVNTNMGVLILTDEYTDEGKAIENVILATDWDAKGNHGGCVYYNESLREQLQQEVKIEALLRTAIDNNELSLLYQPQFCFKAGRVIGVEALVRWKNNELGEISPVTFIPIAERTGLIDIIGEWILRESCKQNRKWQDSGLPRIHMSVNLSPVQFSKDDIIPNILKILDESQLEGKYLGIEVTEGMVVENIDDINQKLKGLKDMDITISIDDFGTGYSSLGYLRKLKLDTLKIDRDFIKDYPENDDGAIARIIINLSNELGLSTIAEGVETQEQLDFIIHSGCHVIQGYYYSPPISAEKIEKILIQQNEGI